MIWIIILSNTFASLISFWVESINMPFAMHLEATCGRFLFSSFTFFAESKNYSTSIFTWTACKYLPQSPSSTEEEQKEKRLFPACALSSLYSTGWRTEQGNIQLLGSLWEGKKRLFSHVQLQGVPAAMLQWHGLIDVPLVIHSCGDWKKMEQFIYPLVTG